MLLPTHLPCFTYAIRDVYVYERCVIPCLILHTLRSTARGAFTMPFKSHQTILKYIHLLESAELHYEHDPPELWRLLQDNDPKHKSVLVQTWLFNHGISTIEFPPYSPDLNPIENLWNDLARRVEARPASTMCDRPRRAYHADSSKHDTSMWLQGLCALYSL